MPESRHPERMSDGEHGKGGSNSPDIPPELKSLEAQLSSLRPREDRLDRERLIFLAGQASASDFPSVAGRRWAWPAAFAGMSTVAAALTLVLLLRGGPTVVEHIVYVPGPPPVTDAPAARDDAPEIPASGGERMPPASHLAARSSGSGGAAVLDPRFRLFDHLLAEEPYRPPSTPHASLDHRRILSPHSLGELLEETMTETPDWTTPHGLEETRS